MTMEQRMDQLEKRNKRLTVALTMMAVAAITIQFSACGDNPFNSSTKCDVSDIGALAGRNLSECDLRGANLWYADLESANLVDVRNLPELSAKQEKDACWDGCG